MGKSRVALTAIGYSCFSFLCIFLAFVSPSWLVTDGTLKNPKFEKLGKANYTLFSSVYISITF